MSSRSLLTWSVALTSTSSNARDTLPPAGYQRVLRTRRVLVWPFSM
ncbi:hypothetical protein ACGFNP_57505 [Nonomuraea sp. NPDC049269]